MRSLIDRPGCPIQVKTLPYLPQALGTVLLHGDGPATQDEPRRPRQGKALGCGDGECRVGLRAHGGEIPA